LAGGLRPGGAREVEPADVVSWFVDGTTRVRSRRRDMGDEPVTESGERARLGWGDTSPSGRVSAAYRRFGRGLA
jgi:hypothetical protein